MLSIGSRMTMERFQKPKPKLNERQMLVKIFLDTLNAQRGNYPPLQAGRIGKILAPIKTKDLYAFLAECRYAENFSKHFWWSANPKKH